MVKVLLNPGPCTHYIWFPTDPAFTISGLPQTLHSLSLVSHSTYTMEMQLF
ncbi:unnamed protein product [Staurois parvus]|uniref:Uncharacterized protein n=1 Tax=Staurois parvus TaxID=386267 RepID=A0ABN9GK43_9NEOB|nr:unnamed protein product [Staurois parvus]